MVYFNELRIDEKTGKLIVDCAILTEALSSVYITKVEVTTHEGINTTNPASSTIIYTKEYEGTATKAIREIFDASSDTMYFVMVYWGGTPPLTAPCSMDTNPILACTVDTCPIYNKMLTQIKEVLYQECTLPQNFIDYFLQYKAFQIAVDTEHYDEAITLYKKYFLNSNSSSSTFTVGCGCTH